MPLSARSRLLGVLLAASTWAGCGKPPVSAERPVPTVTVGRPIQRVENEYQDYTGEAKSVESVDIRARVTGYLVKVNFKDGDLVEKDQLLYEIDPRPFQATLEQAKGRVEALLAAKRLLQIQVDRYRTLVASNAASQQELDEYIAKQAENIGEIKSAEAAVTQAQLNLDFTRIASPIKGKMSRTQWTPGNLVNADETLLTTVMSYDPIYGYFSVDEPTMLRLQKIIRNSKVPVKEQQALGVRMGLVDDVDRRFPLTGPIDFVNNAVDPQTGTILVRAVFRNPYVGTGMPPVITPGAFVRVRLPTGLPEAMLLIAERAIGNDQGKKYVYLVDHEGRIQYRPIKVGLKFHGLQAVSGELKVGDRVVVGGLQRVRPGVTVKAEEVDMVDLAAPGGAEELRAAKSADADASRAADKSVPEKPAPDKTTDKGLLPEKPAPPSVKPNP